MKEDRSDSRGLHDGEVAATRWRSSQQGGSWRVTVVLPHINATSDNAAAETVAEEDSYGGSGDQR